MHRLVHVSDIHFGSEDPAAVRALVDEIARLAPTLVVISGDLTQRARYREFVAARAFLERLPAPRLVIPGNHDIHLLDHLFRVASPRRCWQHAIHHDLDPVHAAPGLAVAGINTARPLAWKNGRISRGQIEHLERFFTAQPPEAFKILVTHHPFLPRPGERRGRLTPRALRVRRVVHECAVDLLLAGHFHQSYTGEFVAMPGEPGTLVVQAGTAASRRVRREPNAFNVLEPEEDALTLTVHAWAGTRFAELRRTRFVRRAGTWAA